MNQYFPGDNSKIKINFVSIYKAIRYILNKYHCKKCIVYLSGMIRYCEDCKYNDNL